MGGGDVHLLMTIRIQIYRLDTGFTYSIKNKGHFISVLSGVMEEDRNAVPHKDFVVTTAEIESIKLNQGKGESHVRSKQQTVSYKSTY